jgi:hypothetical protein
MTDFFPVGFGFQTALLSFFVVWVCWTFLKPIVVKHPLDNIPGPPSPSFFMGERLDLLPNESLIFGQATLDKC